MQRHQIQRHPKGRESLLQYKLELIPRFSPSSLHMRKIIDQMLRGVCIVHHISDLLPLVIRQTFFLAFLNSVLSVKWFSPSDI